MGKMIKLSREQWEAIGAEMGYIKEADAAVPIVASLHARLQEIVDKLGRMGPSDLRHPKLEDEAEFLHGKLGQFERLLDTYGS